MSGGAGDGDGATVRVHLLGVPLRSRERLGRHVEGLLRELALVRISGQRPASSLPARLLELAGELETTYAPQRALPTRAMEEALAAGREFLDVAYDAAPGSAGYVRDLLDVLEEADGFCRSEQLLTLPAPEELVALRRWVFGEFLAQLAGAEPRSWHGPSQRGAPEEPEPALPPLPAPLETTAPGPGAAADGRLVGAPLVLDSVASAVGTARRHVRRALAELGAPELEGSAELGVSELVTNAVLHARTAFSVAVRVGEDGRVRVEVSDSSPVPVQVRRPGASATTGRGLQLVASVSTGWGVQVRSEGDGPGKTVWFEPRAERGGRPDEDAGEAVDATAWAADVAELLQPGAGTAPREG
ncbi:ATP-binding protein [Kineococcus gypseus]|uniref:ATP-binding protein n=1 Tax=Kineococcus gypseus TaxID=1637102 RepID=UPI003D7F083B